MQKTNLTLQVKSKGKNSYLSGNEKSPGKAESKEKSPGKAGKEEKSPGKAGSEIKK